MTTALIAAIVVLMCIGSGNASRSMLTSLALTGPSSTSSALPLLQDVFTFWIKNGPDQQYGTCQGAAAYVWTAKQPGSKAWLGIN